MTTALVLAGHGSHISPHTAGIVWEQVDGLRAMRVADEITAGFWKEQPSFSRVLNTLQADDVTIVPLFTAQGFFTRSVIPSEMGLEGAITQRGGKTIRYAHTIGEHPYLGQIVQQRIRAALAETGFDPAQTAVAVVGHGTKRASDSRTATQAQAQAIEALEWVSEVAAVFLDDTPSIPDVFTLTTAPNLIVVPYFLALGSHTTIDVPGALGLPEGVNRAELRGRQVVYTNPVGVDADLSTLILQLAREAGASLREAGASLCDASNSIGWDGFPAYGRDRLIEAITRHGELCLGELRLTPNEVTVMGDEGDKTDMSDVAVLRGYVREKVHFRSLATSRDLPRGWRVPIHMPSMLHAVVETIYPGVVADWADRDNFHPISFEQVIRRQVGAFRDLADFEGQAEVVRQVCSGCVRHPTWYDSITGDIPCPEGCNHWLSAAKAAAGED